MYCFDSSVLAGEALAGTATQASIWLLLEYNGSWGSKAFEESLIPENVKAHLASLVERIPGARLQLIRQRPANQPEGVALSDETQEQAGAPLVFFVAVASEINPSLFEFRLNDYQDVLEVDIPGLLSGKAGDHKPQRGQSLFLVCTNGRRDPCCARVGSRVYREMSRLVGEAAWQSNHVGGHRFAGNVVCFPHGIFYGRVEPHVVEELVTTYANGRVYLDKMRGRSCYPQVIQAAEIHLRLQTLSTDLEEYFLEGSDEVSPREWAIRFVSQVNGSRHLLKIVVEVTSLEVLQSCNSAKRAPLVRYHLVQHEKRSADGVEKIRNPG